MFQLYEFDDGKQSQEAGCSLRLRSGASVLVYPNQYEIVRHIAAGISLRYLHILVCEAFRSLVQEAARTLAIRLNVLRGFFLRFFTANFRTPRKLRYGRPLMAMLVFGSTRLSL